MKKPCCDAKAAGLAAGVVFGFGTAFASLLQSAGVDVSWTHVAFGKISFFPSAGVGGALAQALGQFVYGFLCGFIALFAGLWLYQRWAK